MPRAMRPSSDWLDVGIATFLKLPGAPVRGVYMPLPGDCGAPAALCLVPARQPTAAITAPGRGDPGPPAACTTTSVTMLARKQFLTDGALPAQLPVGSTTLANVAPASVERDSPPPVAA